MATQYTSILTKFGTPSDLYDERIDDLNRAAAQGWTLVSTVATGFTTINGGGHYLDTFVRTR